MFQTSKKREAADEMPICEKCMLNKVCASKPKTDWRYVLIYCKLFEENNY